MFRAIRNLLMDAAKATLPAVQTAEQRAAGYFGQLHSHCEGVSQLSLSGANLATVAESLSPVESKGTTLGRNWSLLEISKSPTWGF